MSYQYANKKSVWLIGEIMLQKEWISWEELAKALKTQAAEHQLIGQILINRGLVTRKQVMRALAIQSGLEFVELKNYLLDDDAVHAVTCEFCHQYRVIPIERGRKFIRIASCNPLNYYVKAVVARATGLKNIEMVISTPEDIDEAIDHYYHKKRHDIQDNYDIAA